MIKILIKAAALYVFLTSGESCVPMELLMLLADVHTQQEFPS